jgi:hypothetical protein
VEAKEMKIDWDEFERTSGDLLVDIHRYVHVD